jgi:hypothetical protein
MQNNFNKSLSFIFFILMLAACPLSADDPDGILKKAFDAYGEGENAKTVYQRKLAFNYALDLYTGLEKEYEPIYGNGKLYYNIGNTYFQLEEYPWATLYYYRTLKLMPRDERTRSNLSITQNKLGITIKENPSLLSKIFFLQSQYSLPERLRVFFILAVLLLVMISFYIWRPQHWQKSILIILLIGSLIMLSSVLFTRYFSPIEAVMVQSSTLYRDAGEQYAHVSENPILAGNKVVVLRVLQDGEWLKILTPEGEIGYVKNAVIRII